ncbi:MAG: chemotaxis protein CheV [Colwellia sp.]|nr:chemotaxis protein CheV [Colwellia sp.]
MVNILDAVNQRTDLVGKNRLELLLFHLQGRQFFAINVFKVKEVVNNLPLNQLPNSHNKISGVATIRGESIPVIDLQAAIGLSPLKLGPQNNLIITEYNRTIQGLLVGKVDHIINLNWEEIMVPPATVGRHHYLTAITEKQINNINELIEIIDVEKVLAEIVDYKTDISEGVIDNDIIDEFIGRKILHADDSLTARKQVSSTLAQLGVEIVPATNGQEALNILKNWADKGQVIEDEVLMLITDAEMPIMDGYKLTYEIRQDPRLSNLYIVLNTSLSGSFNEAMVEKVGCNRFLSKFQPDHLVNVVQDRLKEKLNK